LDLTGAKYRSGMECRFADARGAQQRGLLRRLLARLKAPGVGVGRQDGQGLGRSYGHAAADSHSR
jgi:hypothetical protein